MSELLEYLEQAVEEHINEQVQQRLSTLQPRVSGSHIVFGGTSVSIARLFSEYIDTRTSQHYIQINEFNELLTILKDIQNEAETKRDEIFADYLPVPEDTPIEMPG